VVSRTSSGSVVRTWRGYSSFAAISSSVSQNDISSRIEVEWPPIPQRPGLRYHSRRWGWCAKRWHMGSSGQIIIFLNDIPDTRPHNPNSNPSRDDPPENEAQHLQGDVCPHPQPEHCFGFLPMHLPPLAPTMAVQSRIDVQPFHARPPSSPNRSSTASPPAKWSNVPRA